MEDMEALVKRTQGLNVSAGTAFRYRRIMPEEKIEYKRRLSEEAEELVFDGKGDIREWRGFVPSRCTVQDGIRHVRVNKPDLIMTDIEPDDQKVTELISKFASIKETEPKSIDADLLRSLALDYGFKTGKWILTFEWDKADLMWQKLALALVDRLMPDDVIAVKISTPNRSPSNIYEQLINISVVTKDFTDIDAVKAAASSIRSFAFYRSMSYKPDIYSVLSIFADNEFDIHPTLYHSNFKTGFFINTGSYKAGPSVFLSKSSRSPVEPSAKAPV